MREGFTAWFTGLPSSGKSTLARLLEAEIRGRGFPVAVLDGDEVRVWLTAGLGFSREDREENLRRIAHLAALLNRAGVIAITAAISPYESARRQAREIVGRFVEVYVDCPLAVCEARDVKGLYKKARRGEVARFTGVSDPYEPPASPDVVVRTGEESPAACAARIVAALEATFLPRDHVRQEAVVPARLVHALAAEPAAVAAALAGGAGASPLRAPLTESQWKDIGERLRALGYLR